MMMMMMMMTEKRHTTGQENAQAFRGWQLLSSYSQPAKSRGISSEKQKQKQKQKTGYSTRFSRIIVLLFNRKAGDDLYFASFLPETTNYVYRRISVDYG